MSKTESALSADVTAPAKARTFVRQALVDYSDIELISDAELLTSELVTNATMHGLGKIHLTLKISDDGVRISVDDASPNQPAPRESKATDENGRGLKLVARISDDWGVKRTPRGKSVWFALRTKR